MKRTKECLLAVALLFSGAAAATAQDATDIMNKYGTAVGLDNWARVKTEKMVVSFPVQGTEMNMTVTSEKDKATRMDMSVMGMSGWVIIQGKQGWMMMPPMLGGSGKVDTMKPEMMAQFEQMDFRKLKKQFAVDYKAEGTKLEYTGRDTINNAPCYKVKMTTKDGQEATHYIDCSTYYLVRSETTAMVNDQEQEIAAGFSNYKKMDEGIVMPMTITAGGQEVTFKSVELNKPLDPNVFIPKADTTATPDIKK